MSQSQLQPRLVGETLVLRGLTPEDGPALFAVASDREIWAVHPAHDRWQEPVFRRFFADALESGGALIVEDARTGEVIGSSRYDARRANPGEIEIGWTFLARKHWGGATNAEMKRLMLAHALQFVERVIFIVGEDNLRSRRAMAKVGARLTDRTYEIEMAGRLARHVIFAIDREDFANGLQKRYPVA
ncbi:MAG: GNAT family N-acetyltransferase [Steroidobacteraceae bacterium]